MKKILRIFPRRTALTPTDPMSFVGEPSMFRPDADEVHISCTFTWDIPKAERLQKAWAQYYPIVKIGGPAFDDPGNDFTPGMYLKQGVTMTSRGCNNNCSFCLVPKREGKIRLLPILEGRILQDNNILQCPDTHIDNVFDMLSHQYQVELTGGLEAARITEPIANQIRSLRLKQLFLACDTDAGIKPLRNAIKLLQIPRDKVRCYVLIGADYSKDIDRLMQVWEAGALPFAQLYQPPDKFIEYSKQWRDLARNWSRPAIMKSINKITSFVKK